MEDSEGGVTSLDELWTQSHAWTTELDEHTLEGAYKHWAVEGERIPLPPTRLASNPASWISTGRTTYG
jgi:hypothetical protein